MNTLTLEQVFGVGATQDSSTLIIQKSSLLLLTPSPSNTAESILTAILLTALKCFQGTLMTEAGNTITDEHGTPITYDNSDNFTSTKIIEWQPFQSKRDSLLVIINQLIVFLYDAI